MEREVLRWIDRQPIPMTQVIEGHDHALSEVWFRWNQVVVARHEAHWKERSTYLRNLEEKNQQELDAHMKQWEAENPLPQTPPQFLQKIEGE